MSIAIYVQAEVLHPLVLVSTRNERNQQLNRYREPSYHDTSGWKNLNEVVVQISPRNCNTFYHLPEHIPLRSQMTIVQKISISVRQSSLQLFLQFPQANFYRLLQKSFYKQYVRSVSSKF